MAYDIFYRKARIFLTYIFCIALMLSSIASNSMTIKDEDPLEENFYYLVVGAFQMPQNAKRYKQFLKSKGHSTSIGLNTHKSLYYVYLNKNKEYLVIDEQRDRVRETELFKDAWIYFESPPFNEFVLLNGSNDQISYESGSPERNYAKEDNTSHEEEIVGEEFTEEESVEPNYADENTAEEETEEKADIPISVEEEATEDTESTNGRKIVVYATNATNYQEVVGSIEVIDVERKKEMQTLETNSLQRIKYPNTTTNKVILLANIFGYKQDQVLIDLNSPEENDQVKVENDTIMVDLELNRMTQGDIAVMYQVYFYNDAAVMKQESAFQLNQLLDMLKENESTKIKIHGHTNSNARGEYVPLGPGNNFFSIPPGAEKESGSAKELSEARAATIKKWLISKGIDESRIELKGWGGKKMIYDKFSPSAEKNARVEIEII